MSRRLEEDIAITDIHGSIINRIWQVHKIWVAINLGPIGLVKTVNLERLNILQPELEPNIGEEDGDH